MARTLTVRSRTRSDAASRNNPFGWIYVVVAFMVCTYVICHAFPADVPRSTLSKDAYPESDPVRSVSAQDLG